MKKKFYIILLMGLVLTISSCKTKEVPGRRRAPRHCNTCTKWSYVPQEALDTLFFQSTTNAKRFRPTKEEEYLCTERLRIICLQ